MKRYKPKPMPHRALSLLMSGLLLLGALPLLPFSSYAEQDLAPLGNALQGLSDLQIRNDVRGKTHTTETTSGDSPGFYNTKTSGSWVVSLGGQSVWNALQLYGAAAADVYQNEFVGSSITGTGDHNRREAPAGSDSFSRGKNTTAEEIRATLEARVADPNGVLPYFSGHFKVNTSGNAEAAYDLLDVPRITFREATRKYIWNSWSWGNMVLGWWKSVGSFAVLRSGKEALFSGSANLNDYGATAELATAAELYYSHATKASNSWEHGTTGTSTKGWKLWFLWHQLEAAPKLHYGASVQSTQVAASEKVAELSTAALKAWRDLPWQADLPHTSYSRLLQMLQDYNQAVAGLAGSTFPTGTAGQATTASLASPANADILTWFGLPSIAEGEAFAARIEAAMAALYGNLCSYADAFGQPGQGRLVTPPLAKCNQTEPVSFDPRPSYAGKNLPQLQALEAEARAQHEALLQAAQDEGTEAQAIWQAVQAHAQGSGYAIDLPAQQAWLANLARVIALWQVRDLWASTQSLLQQSANYHAGDRPTPDANTQYTHSYAQLQAWIEEIDGSLAWLAAGRAGGNAELIQTIFVDAAAEEALQNRRDELVGEQQLRRDAGYSEETWYSYRDYFTPLTANDYSTWSDAKILGLLSNKEPHSNAPRPALQGVLGNYEAYRTLSAAAKAELGEPLWQSIYGNYAERVIEPLLTQMLSAPGARLRQSIREGMALVQAAEDEGSIAITKERNGQPVHVLSWRTMSAMATLLQALEQTPHEDKTVYATLEAWGRLDVLGTEGYTSAQAQADYAFLRGAVAAALAEVQADPSRYFVQTEVPVAERQPQPNDLVPGHSYTDTNNAGLGTLIKQLDAAAGQDLAPWLRLAQMDPATLGLQPGEPVRSATILDAAMRQLYSDESLNALIDAFYPVVLTEFEKTWASDVFPEGAPGKIGDVNESGIAVRNIFVQFKPLYDVMDTSDTFGQLRLYPRLLGSTLPAEFAAAKAQLMAVEPYQKTEYPSANWKQSGLYDADGKLQLEWGIQGDEAKFKRALALVFNGMYPLLAALLLGQNKVVHNSNIGELRGSISSSGLGGLLVGSFEGEVELNLSFGGNAGYAKLFTPIYESLLGQASGSIPTPEQLQGIGNSAAIAEALFAPLEAYLQRLRQAPLSELLQTLPNLGLLFTLGEVKTLVQNSLIISDVRFYGAAHARLGSLINRDTTISGSIKPIDVGKLVLKGNDYPFLSDLNALLAMVAGEGTLPKLSASTLASLGQLHTAAEPDYATRRVPLRGTAQRYYVESNQAAVLQTVLQALQSAGTLPNNATAPSELAAALAELANPKGYPQPRMQWGEPAFVDPAAVRPHWWSNSQADAAFLVEHGDAALTLVWQALTGTAESFGQGLQNLLQTGLFTPAALEQATQPIRTALASPAMQSALSEHKQLLNTQFFVGGAPLRLAQIAEQLQALPSTAGITNQQSFVVALCKYLEPAAPLLEVLLSGSSIECIDTGTGGVLRVQGGNGYANAVQPLLSSLVAPLGLEASVMPPEQFATQSANAKLQALFAPLEALCNTLLQAPVQSGLALLPTVSYLASPGKGGEASPVQQALEQLLRPFYVGIDTLRPLFDITQHIPQSGWPGGLAWGAQGVQVQAAELINEGIGQLLRSANLPMQSQFQLGSLLLGTANGNQIVANQPDVLLALLGGIGVFEYLQEQGMQGLVDLLGQGRLPQVLRIDYSQAPQPVAVTLPRWVQKEQLQYLAENGDAVLQWAWDTLVGSNAAGRASLQAQWGIPLQASLEETLRAWLGTELYSQRNLNQLAAAALRLRDSLQAQTLPNPKGGTVPLGTVLQQLLSLSGTPLNIDTLFAGFAAYQANPPAVQSEASFKAALTQMLVPAMPLLRLLLAGSDLEVLGAAGGTAPLITIKGSNGYATALRPLLLGLGVGVQGYAPRVLSASEFAALQSPEAQIAALLDPVLFLLERLSTHPVGTALAVLPNLAFWAGQGSGGTSLLAEALNRLLHPVNTLLPRLGMAPLELGDLGLAEGLVKQLHQAGLPAFALQDLVVGELQRFAPPNHTMGQGDAATFLAVDSALWLGQLANRTGLFAAVEQNNLQGLVALLNNGRGGSRRPLAPLSYPGLGAQPQIYNTWLWFPWQAEDLARSAPQLLDQLFQLLYGKPFGAVPGKDGTIPQNTVLFDQLGAAVYTEQNFKALLQAVGQQIPSVLGTPVLGEQTLGALLQNVVQVGGQPVEVEAILQHLQTYSPKRAITNKASFRAELTAYLLPAMPLLNFMLAGQDLTVGKAQGQAVLIAPGYQGYAYGLVPLYEALLLPLGQDQTIASPARYQAMANEQKAEALLEPVLALLDAIVANPYESLLRLAPNVSYWVTAPSNGESLLQGATNRIVYALSHLVQALPGGSEGGFSINTANSINALLQSVGLELNELQGLQQGKLQSYTSRSGEPAKWLEPQASTPAALVTVLLRQVARQLQSEPMRGKAVALVLDSLGLTGFARTLMAFWLQCNLGFLSWWNTPDLYLSLFYGLFKCVQFLLPVVLWFQSLFT